LLQSKVTAILANNKMIEMKCKVLCAIILIAGFSIKESAAQPATHDIHSLKFLGEYDIPHKMNFEGTVIGGLSGIDYDAKNDVYYIISDDRSSFNPARFYTVKIKLKNDKIETVIFKQVTSLKQPNGKVYPTSAQDAEHTPDPEGIRFNPFTKKLVWTSEGERIVKFDKKVLEDPSIIEMNMNGEYKDSFELPDNMHMHATENGPRQNGVFEGLTFSGDYKKLYVNVEEPIYEDGNRAGLGDSTGWIRILKFDTKTKKPEAEYAYQIDAVANPPLIPGSFKINGVPDILWVGTDKLLVTERSFSTGYVKCVIKVYFADLSKSTNVIHKKSLKDGKSFIPAKKKLLLNMNSLHMYTDNIEGATFGPTLKNGHRTLVFVSDDNFAIFQKTQLLLFEID
jgi:Uncharacterized protein conserved in bacteria